MDVKGHSYEVSDRNVEHIVGNWRKSNPYKVAKNCTSVFWKVKLESNKIGYLVEKTSKQNVQEVTWFAYGKIQEEKDKLKARMQTGICSPVFIAALFTIAKR